MGISLFLSRKARFINSFLQVMNGLFLAVSGIYATFASSIAKDPAFFDLFSYGQFFPNSFAYVDFSAYLCTQALL